MGCCFSAEGRDEEPKPLPPVSLSEQQHGPGVIISNRTISGTGSVLGDSPILQDKGYFEATIIAPGTFAIGVAAKDSNLDGVLSPDKASSAWTITNNQPGIPPLAVGDVIGCAIDQADYPVQ